MWTNPFSSLASGLVFADDTTDIDALDYDLRDAGWRVGRCIVTPADDKTTVINSIREQLGFPTWTGSNLDALYDALTDLSWLDAQRIALIIDRTPAARQGALDGWEQIREVLFDVTAWWQSSQCTFVAVVR